MDSKVEIEINGVPVKWNLEQGIFTFFGIDSALFWLNPSMLSMLQPLVDEIGADLFCLLIAHSASLGTDEDYQNMVSVLGDTFEEGFANWGKAVSAAGWGVFQITAFDDEHKTANVRVSNAWELLLGSAPSKRWGCPFIQGKLIGIFNHALQANCWAEQVDISYEPQNAYVEFHIHPSEKTISAEIEALRKVQKQQKEALLSSEISKKTQQLHASENRFRQLAEVSSDWVWEMDKDLRFSYFSTAYFNFEKIGFDTASTIGKTRQQLIAKDELKKPKWKQHLSDLENRREFRDFQYELITPDGEKHYFQINGVPVYDEEGNFMGYRGTGSDLTEKIRFVQSLEAAKKEAEKNLEKVSELNLQLQTEVAHRHQAVRRLNGLSQYDYLTGALNRVQLKENLQKLLVDQAGRSQPMGLMFIGLQGIETVNLNFGLEMGDAVLVEVSLLIEDAVRENDMIARSSGAEFIVLLPDCASAQVAEAIAARIIEAIEQPFESIAQEKISACIGISIFSGDSDSAETLLSSAYQVMHEARVAGKAILLRQFK